jgi:hypothetical protein
MARIGRGLVDEDSREGLVKRLGFTAILGFWGLIGAFLRLYLIADQVLLDDEWHALFTATAHPLVYLLRYANGAATSAPLNAYAWILLHTTGWSEMALRLPPLACGLLALVVFPLLVRRVHGEAAASIFAGFVALSPFLTHYSRIFRPYSALALFEFAAIYSAGIWLQTGQGRFRVFYVLASAAALYFHPVAALGVLAPWGVVGALLVWKAVAKPSASVPDFRPGWRSIVLTAALIVLVFIATLQPALIAENMAPGPAPTIETWKQLMLMVFGTSSVVLASGLLVSCLAGAWTILRADLLWGAIFALVVFLHLLMIAVCRFMGIEVPVVLARYFTILFPLAHVCVAIGLTRLAFGIGGLGLLRKAVVRGLTVGLAILLFSLLVRTSPLLSAYAAPNNFTSHSAFIESAQFGGWEGRYRSGFLPNDPTIGPPRMSSFYRVLPPRARRLIEYPMMLGDHCNNYYLYQHRHGKQIVIGYTDIVDDMPVDRDGVVAEHFVNHVIRAVDDKSRLRFRNMVDILDAGAVRRSHADYLICHKDLIGEFLPGAQGLRRIATPGMKECVERSAHHFGPPVFEDETIVVFGLTNSSTGAR